MAENSTDKAPEKDAKPKAPPRKPAEYVVLTPTGEAGTYREIGRTTAVTAKKAKSNVAAELSTSGQLEGDGVELLAVPARGFVPERARVEARPPVVRVG